jgi:hypothetical protein
VAGFHPNNLLRAVYDRLNGDTGTGGLRASSSPLASAVYTRRFPLPRGSDFPYAICYFDAIQNEDTLTDEQKRVGVSVEWICESQASGVDGTERAGLIMARVIGNWADRLDRAPTHGLAHWTPSVQSGWASGPMMFESASYSRDELGTVRWSALFGVMVNKVRA